MRTIVVTGANRGIGLEIASQLAKAGNQVIMTCRDTAKGAKAIATITELGGSAQLVALDVSDEQSIGTFSSFLADHFKSIDGLVNNAAVSLDEGRSLHELPMEILNQTMKTNFHGPLLLIRALLPLLKNSKDPRVVNISSGLGAMSDMSGGYGSYRVSKVALNAMTAILAAELDGDRIVVNSVCPGWVRTDMGGAAATRSVEEGAETPVWLMSEHRDKLPNGRFLRDKKLIEW